MYLNKQKKPKGDVYHVLAIICANNEALQKWIYDHSNKICKRDSPLPKNLVNHIEPSLLEATDKENNNQ